MDPSPDLDVPARPMTEDRPPPSPDGFGARAATRLRAELERLVLWLHRQAERRDLVPVEFGDETAVDPDDARAVAREWLRQARLWAAYNPEEMLALKAGAAALGAALIALVILVAAIR